MEQSDAEEENHFHSLEGEAPQGGIGPVSTHVRYVGRAEASLRLASPNEDSSPLQCSQCKLTGLNSAVLSLSY
jgi:hypothetical protein